MITTEPRTKVAILLVANALRASQWCHIFTNTSLSSPLFTYQHHFEKQTHLSRDNNSCDYPIRKTDEQIISQIQVWSLVVKSTSSDSFSAMFSFCKLLLLNRLQSLMTQLPIVMTQLLPVVIKDAKQSNPVDSSFVIGIQFFSTVLLCLHSKKK